MPRGPFHPERRQYGLKGLVGDAAGFPNITMELDPHIL